MTLLASLLLLGALQFDQQDLGGIYIGAVDTITSSASTNYVHADFNQDGRQDLLLPTEVFFQDDNGRFTIPATPLPALETPATLQIWDNELYCQTTEGLQVYTWKDGTWEVSHSSNINLPAELHSGEGVQLGRFLHDFNSDGVPEVVAVAADGVHLHVRGESQFSEAGVLQVLPPLELVVQGPVRLWPPEERKLSLPVRERSFRLLFQDNRITVLQRLAADEHFVWRWRRYEVDPVAWKVDAATAEEGSSAPMPEFLRPCRLNSDETLDFAGGTWQESKATFYGLPLYETWVSMNNGADFRLVRSPSFQRFRPHCSFVDLDGDGDSDLVAESAELFRSGPRELITQLLTRTSVDHLIQVYRQGPNGFSPEPAWEFRVRIQLETVPSRNGPVFQRYQMGELISFTGDFDGDTFKDVAVREGLHELSIYLSRDGALGAHRAFAMPVQANEDVRIVDLNADGRSDIVLQPRQTRENTSPRSRVYFSKGNVQ